MVFIILLHFFFFYINLSDPENFSKGVWGIFKLLRGGGGRESEAYFLVILLCKFIKFDPPPPHLDVFLSDSYEKILEKVLKHLIKVYIMLFMYVSVSY